MANFKNYAVEAAQLETEIARKAAILGIDWNNSSQVRALAQRALSSHGDTLELDHPAGSPKGKAMLEIVGLSQLMLKAMREGANEDILTHGGQIWKTLAQALWEEAGLARSQS